MSKTPLEEVQQEESLSELFSKDALSLSQQDIKTIITNMRRLRQLWLSQEQEKQSKAKKPKPLSNLSQAQLDLLS